MLNELYTILSSFQCSLGLLQCHCVLGPIVYKVSIVRFVLLCEPGQDPLITWFDKTNYLDLSTYRHMPKSGVMALLR